VSPLNIRADSLQIIRENGGGNVANVDLIAEAVWDYLESNTTVQNSMKDFLQKAKDHAKAANMQTKQ